MKSDGEKVKKGKSETFDLSLIIPEDFNDDNDYILFIKSYEKNREDSQCIYEIIDINLNREKHDVVIENVLIDSPDIYSGTDVEVNVKVENIGAKDEEDVYVSVTNEILGIFEKSAVFDIDEGDSFSEIFNINIPDNATGEYVFDAKVMFDDNENSKSKIILVLKKQDADVVKLKTINLNNAVQSPKIENTIVLTGKVTQEKFFQTTIKKFDFEKYWPLYLISLLIIGIIILIILIIRVLLY